MSKPIRTLTPINIGTITKSVLASYQQTASADKLDVTVHIMNNLPTTYLDEAFVTATIDSLLLLATVTAPAQSVLTIDVQSVTNELHVRINQVSLSKSEVVDNASIAPKTTSRLHELEYGLLKQTVQLAAHSGGKVTNNANDRHEVTYAYILPVLTENTDFANEMAVHYMKKKNKAQISESIPQRKKLLVIDGQYDKSSDLYKALFQQYEVFISRNAKDGFEKTHKILPSILLLGELESEDSIHHFFELISGDIKTNYIPIIQLVPEIDGEITSITYSKSHLLGSKEMTDDELLNVVNKTIELSDQIKRNLLESLSRQGRVFFREPIEQLLRVEEHEFLKNIARILERSFMDPKLCVESLAEQMFVSKSRLQRKVIALSGDTASSMIRSFRLKKAKQLLVSIPEVSVASISIKCGFSDANYFSTVFSREYGLSPLRYRHQYWSCLNSLNQ